MDSYLSGEQGIRQHVKEGYQADADPMQVFVSEAENLYKQKENLGMIRLGASKEDVATIDRMNEAAVDARGAQGVERVHEVSDLKSVDLWVLRQQYSPDV